MISPLHPWQRWSIAKHSMEIEMSSLGYGRSTNRLILGRIDFSSACRHNTYFLALIPFEITVELYKQSRE